MRNFSDVMRKTNGTIKAARRANSSILNGINIRVIFGKHAIQPPKVDEKKAYKWLTQSQLQKRYEVAE